MYPDDGSATPDPLVTLSTSALDQEEYSYYVTFYQSGGLNIESRPTQLIGPFSVSGTSSRIRIDNLPQPTDPMFDQVRIYRNTGASSTRFLLVDTLDAGVTTYIDSKSDIAIDVLEAKEIDLLGARATNTTKLVDVVIRNGDQYIPAFVEGTLSFNGRKGGRTLSAKELTIDGDPVTGTNVNDLRLFMQQAFGMDTSQQDVGSTTTNGVLRFTSNVGIENELSVSLNAFQITQDDGSTVPVSLGFDVTTDATGEGSTTTFVVFDALGQPVNVRMTTARVDSAPGVAGATYKWFVTSEDTQPDGVSVNTFVASGDLVFDLQGNIVQPDNGIEEISIDRTSDLTFNLDFSSVSGLTVTNAQGQPVSTMNLQRQDGFPTGTLTSFTITESGLIRGVFSNGAERALGQLLMAKFANTTGLQQVGNNLFTKGINSGEPITNIPGAEGIGTLTAGAVELSNTDIGQNLIQLILASTQYRGGARVITTTQQLLDELLNLRR
jgi:flagellar hook protein FlgE